jgi:hypothetical protein
VKWTWTGTLLHKALRFVAPCCLSVFTLSSSQAADEAISPEVQELRRENSLLRERLDKQDKVIDSLTAKVANIEDTVKNGGNSDETLRQTLSQKVSTLTKVNISGQIAAGFFDTGAKGMFPNSEFRLDDSRVTLEAQAWEDVYGYFELNVMTREAFDDAVRIGEVYIDLERVLKWRGLDSSINLRIGRFYTPYGEEYSVRNPIDNPLISHSLADFWGYDSGIELYGSRGPLSYAIAVQDGGVSVTRDFTTDKLVAGRVSYQPKNWLRASVSAMRTGNLSAQNDSVSSMWFGNGFFRSLGTPSATTRYHADMAEADLQFLWSRGHLKLSGGGIRYDDNDRSADNQRDIYYYSAEGMLRFAGNFYGAARFSQIFAHDGFPIVGNGTWGEYFYSKLTDDLWRLSLGLGYTPNPNLVFKVEYTFERGTTIGTGDREHEDFFGAQAALRF